MDALLAKLNEKYGDAIAESGHKRYVCRFCHTEEVTGFTSGRNFVSHMVEHLDEPFPPTKVVTV